MHGTARLGERLPRDGPAPLGTLPEDMHDALGIAREVLAPSPDRGEQAMQDVDQVVLERHVAQAAGSVSLLERLERGPVRLERVQVGEDDVAFDLPRILDPRVSGNIKARKEGDPAPVHAVAVSSDGGLIARGHPGGPTGLAQIWETTLQLRGTAGKRQVPNARAGLCHMMGGGSVCAIHILQRE